jgi:hypothetical protein
MSDVVFWSGSGLGSAVKIRYVLEHFKISGQAGNITRGSLKVGIVCADQLCSRDTSTQLNIII